MLRGSGNSMQRILFVVDDPFPLSPQSPAVEIAKGLQGRGWQVHFVHLDVWGDESIGLPGAAELQHYVRWNVTPRWGNIFRRLLAMIREVRPTLIHVWGEQANFWTRLAVRLTRPSLILSQSTPGGANADVKLAEISDLGLAVRPEVQAGQATELKRQLNVPLDAHLVGTVAPCRPRQRLKDVLWAADLVTCIRDDVYWLLIGDGPQRWHLERYASHLETGDHVRFLGWRGDSESIVGSLDILVQPSTEHCDFAALSTGLKYGVPLVTTSRAWHLKFVEHGKTGYAVEWGARNEIARCVNRLANQPELAARMGEVAKQKFQAEFHFPSVLEQWIARYQAMIGA